MKKTSSDRFYSSSQSPLPPPPCSPPSCGPSFDTPTITSTTPGDSKSTSSLPSSSTHTFADLRQAIRDYKKDLVIEILHFHPNWIDIDISPSSSSTTISSTSSSFSPPISTTTLTSTTSSSTTTSPSASSSSSSTASTATFKVDNGFHAIHYAAAFNLGTLIMGWLLQQGVDINSKAIETGETPLLLATSVENIAMITYLLKHRASLNDQDNQFGETPLIRASGLGNLEVVKIFLQAHAMTHLTNKNHRSAMQVACEKTEAPEMKKEKIRKLILDSIMDEERRRLATDSDNSGRDNDDDKRGKQSSFSPMIRHHQTSPPPPHTPTPSTGYRTPVSQQKSKRRKMNNTPADSSPSISRSLETLFTPSPYSRHVVTSDNNSRDRPFPGNENNSLEWEQIQSQLKDLQHKNQFLIRTVNELNEKQMSFTVLNTKNLNTIQILQEQVQTMEDLRKKLIYYEGKDDYIEGISSMEKLNEIIHTIQSTFSKLMLRKESLLKQEKENSLNCIICRERMKSIVVLPCAHLCLCNTCFQENYQILGPNVGFNQSITNSYLKCPICRKQIDNFQQVFL